MFGGILASLCRRNTQTLVHCVPVSPSCSLSPLQNLFDHLRSFQPRLSNETGKPNYVPPSNGEIYECLVGQYQGSYSSKHAKQLHLQIFKHGFTSDVFLPNTLINVYARSGDVVSAQKLFDEMPFKNNATWACLISGYTQNDMPDAACGIFKEMVITGFTPTRYALSNALRACHDLGPSGFKIGMQIHGLISKAQYASDALVCNGLISMYGSCSISPAYAHCVFEDLQVKNSISWNSIISVYSQRGDALSSFEIFSGMQFSFIPNEYTFATLITVAASSAESGKSLLEQILTSVNKYGYLQDLYVGSALVSGFGKVGLIDNGRKIFEQMSGRNAVSVNGLMVGFIRQKRGEEAVEAFRENIDLVRINSNSYAVLLSAFPEFLHLEEGRRRGREVHAYVIRTGLSNFKVAVANGLINMYAKCNAIGCAWSVFRLMAEKDSVSWNSMICGFNQNKCFEDAVVNFYRMRKSGLMLTNFAIISALSSCASLGWVVLGAQIHCEGLKAGLDLDTSVSNALISLYAETKCLSMCRKVFSLMLKYDQVSWNSMIGAFSNSESTTFEAVKYFLEMMRMGWDPNKVSFINILTAVSSLSLHELNLQIHALVLKYSVEEDIAIENALLLCYGKCKRMEDCEKIFARMHDRRDEGSWNNMISGYIHNELLNKAMELVWLMVQRGQRLNCFTFATVLSACASVATLEQGMEVHACEVRACLESDVVVGSALVDMYSKCGRIDYASKIFKLMPVKNAFSWNSMISGYARHGLGRKALDLFRQMEIEGQLPDHVTFVGVLSACSHAGLVQEGFEHFESMSEVYGLAPQMEHFSCMVALIGRAGELKKLEDFVNKMPMKPNGLIWRTVLGACCRTDGRHMELGVRASEMLLELEPQNSTNYVLLSNMYATGGKWEDAAKARTLMRKAAANKEAGCSWVTMKDGVHVFVAGDTSHPDNDLIHKKLIELHQRIREAGYVPQTKFALYDLEQENKEELLSYHSEKLAVAFILTRQSIMPLRIMKNLRVCGDCHSAFLYISKVFGRQIVLRDSIRFHHFIDGACSCGNYW